LNAFAGIGSREITSYEKILINKVSSLLCQYNYILYSGNADGADITFQEGSRGQCVVFLPWDRFNINKFDYTNKWKCRQYFEVGHEEKGFKSVEDFHPNPKVLSVYAHALMTRNYFQVMGYDRYPKVDFVLCCANEDKKGNVQGGTGQACRIAKSLNIPVINIRNPNWKELLKTTHGK